MLIRSKPFVTNFFGDVIDHPVKNTKLTPSLLLLIINFVYLFFKFYQNYCFLISIFCLYVVTHYWTRFFIGIEKGLQCGLDVGDLSVQSSFSFHCTCVVMLIVNLLIVCYHKNVYYIIVLKFQKSWLWQEIYGIIYEKQERESKLDIFQPHGQSNDRKKW